MSERTNNTKTELEQPFKKRLYNHPYTPTLLTAILLALLFFMSMFIAYRSQTETVPSITDNRYPQDTLIKVEYTGGLCPNGACYTSYTIQSNGDVNKNGEFLTTLDKSEVNSLKQLVSTTNFKEIRSRPFTGTCPIAYDGQEVTYTFYTPQGEEVLPSCTYEIDESAPLFSELVRIIREVN